MAPINRAPSMVESIRDKHFHMEGSICISAHQMCHQCPQPWLDSKTCSGNARLDFNLNPRCFVEGEMGRGGSVKSGEGVKAKGLEG